MRSVAEVLFRVLQWLVQTVLEYFIQSWLAVVSLGLIWSGLRKGFTATLSWVLHGNVPIPVWLLILFPILIWAIRRIVSNLTTVEYGGLRWREESSQMIPHCPKCGREVLLRKIDVTEKGQYKVKILFLCPKHGLVKPSKKEVENAVQHKLPRDVRESIQPLLAQYNISDPEFQNLLQKLPPNIQSSFTRTLLQVAPDGEKFRTTRELARIELRYRKKRMKIL